MAVKAENVIAFLDAAGMIGKYLLNEDAGVGVVDANGDFHLFKRQDSRIWLRFVTRDENPGIAPGNERKSEKNHKKFKHPFHGRVCSEIRTRPLSVPT